MYGYDSGKTATGNDVGVRGGAMENMGRLGKLTGTEMIQ